MASSSSTGTRTLTWSSGHKVRAGLASRYVPLRRTETGTQPGDQRTAPGGRRAFADGDLDHPVTGQRSRRLAPGLTSPGLTSAGLTSPGLTDITPSRRVRPMCRLIDGG
ncbi:MAG TPA: hypothetical protein VHN16_08575 [Streptosporangiaceae bacterium]|nr:hypothetical protein [Streptosporangiaceae bacterium]